MNFHEKHDRWMTGLDNAYEALVEAREREIYEDEFIRDWILTDDVLFQRLARKWLDDPINQEGFLDWAIEEARRERDPQWQRAWEDEPVPNMASWERAQRGE